MNPYVLSVLLIVLALCIALTWWTVVGVVLISNKKIMKWVLGRYLKTVQEVTEELIEEQEVES